MSQENVRTFFNDPGYLKNSSDRIEIRANIVKSLLGMPVNKNILDIGCGDGSLSLPMLTTSNKLTLIDIAENMIEKVSQRIPPHLKKNSTLINDSFEKINPDEKFDIIVCIGVIAHIPDIAQLWQMIAKVLKSGGVLIIETTPNPYPIGKLLFPYYYLRSKFFGHKPSYTKNRLKANELISSAAEIGLQKIQLIRYSFPLPGMSHWPHMIKLRYTLFTLNNPLMSKIGSEHIFLFQKI